MRKRCKNDDVKAAIETLKGLTMDLAYGEGGLEDFEIITQMGDAFEELEDIIAGIEDECDRQKEQARKLRIMHGNQFLAECDAAGIK